MNKLLFSIILFGFIQGKSQEITFIQRLPFPDSLVSSEISIDQNGNKLIAAILAVKPHAQDPTYHTVILKSLDLGKNWLVENTRLSEKAADPHIAFLDQDNFVVNDISEGNRFHLKSFLNSGQIWTKEITHGMGHDYATILTDSTAFYIFSTQKKEDKMALYVHEEKEEESSSHSIDILNGADLSFKKPVLFDDLILLPMALRGKRNETKSLYFDQMSSWLLQLNKEDLRPNAPILMTNESGAKHHILLKGNDQMLYFFFTDVERKKLKVIHSIDGGITWGSSTSIAESDNLVNLDAAIWHGEYAVVVFTVEESKGIFQKYVMTLTEKSEPSISIKLGEPSRPDERNGWAARAWPQGGDYCGLVADGSGGVYVVWSSAPDGIFKPYFSKIIFQ